MDQALPKGEIDRWLADHAEWTHRDGEIHKQFRFADFRGSIAFVNAVAELAEAAEHHPDITIHYSSVRIALATHDAGGVTQKDFDLAAQIDRAFQG